MSLVTRYFGYSASEGYGDGWIPPLDMNPGQIMPRQSAHLQHPMDQVILPGVPSHTVFMFCTAPTRSCLCLASD